MNKSISTSAASATRWTLAAGACAFALAACMAPFAQAHAATASTAVTIAADDERISITAPLRVDMVVSADGTFIAPNASDTRIENKSIFGVHVSNIEILPAEGHSIVTENQFAVDEHRTQRQNPHPGRRASGEEGPLHTGRLEHDQSRRVIPQH